MLRKLIYLVSVFMAVGLIAPAASQAVDMDIGYALEPPVIDGEVDALWESASTQTIVPVGDPNDASGRWQALYDSENLYVIVDVSDESLVNDSDASWQDDSVEFYFDGGNTKLGPPLGDNRRQYTFGWATEEVEGVNTVLDGVEHVQVDTAAGWRIEMKLPWMSLQGAEPVAGDLIGIDCFYNDDDDGDTRDDQIFTFATDGSGWEDASQWGTAMLLAIPAAKDPIPTDGATGVSVAPVISTYISGDVPKDIPDWEWTLKGNVDGEVTSTLDVPDSIAIKDLNVELDITKPGKNADLNVYLTSPDGKRVKLFDDVDLLHSHFTNTILDDEAGTSITNGRGPFRGIFKPEGKLSDFDDRDSLGTWKLKITDDWPGGPGKLNAWRIVVENPMTVSWTPGSGDSQDVYFSDHLDDVNGVGDAGLLANLPIDATSIEVGDLATGTTYYWRVDEIGADGSLINIGDVWSFSTSMGNIDVNQRIIASGDDVEEQLDKDGGMYMDSSDLEFPYEDEGQLDLQRVGLRFVDIGIPADSEVLASYIEFEVDNLKGGTEPVSVILDAELSPNAEPFTLEPYNLSNRVFTETVIPWSVPEFTQKDEKFQTPDVTMLVEEVLSQEGWAFGNAIVFSIQDDPLNPSLGVRETESYDGEASAAPLLHIAGLTETAQNPSPADGAIDVLQETILGWSAGFTGVSRDVYFGTENPPKKLESTTGTTFDVGKLAVSTTYYWKIDEVDAAGLKHDGAVWSFATVIGEATNPYPADQATDVPVDVIMTWTPGATAVSHDVYLGTTDPPEFSGNTEENVFDTTTIGGLALGTTYYWRLDAVEADGTTHVGDVWSFTTQPDQATDPSPADGAFHDGTEGTLGWTAGQDALSHDVYFGTDPDALEFVINQTEALLAIGIPDGPAPEGLALGTTYYWRIDEVYPDVTGTGEVWSFTIQPDQATEPSPADGAFLDDTVEMLSWTAGQDALSHDVYFGTDPDALEFVINQTEALLAIGIPDGLAPEGLVLGTTYYWRIDEVYPSVTSTGEVWSFTTKPPPQAYNPNPADGAVDVATDVQLSWKPGFEATLHYVHFGDDLDKVSKAGGAAPVADTTFDPGPLEPGKTYYWRVDEFSSPDTIKGEVWSFTTVKP